MGQANSECYLCGAPATTKDHVPPKGIFPQPRPSNLITVPACADCNEGTKLDDEYFRLIVAAGSNDSPQSTSLLRQRIIPQLHRSPALVVNLLRSMRRTEVRTPAGLVLGCVPVFPIDRPRIQVVINKTVRGLFFKHSKRRLPQHCVVDDFHYKPRISESLAEIVASLPLFEVGDGSVFSYRFHLPDPEGTESYWFLMFYNDTSLFVTNTT